MKQRSLDEVFDDYLKQRGVFKNKNKVSTSYNPMDLPHREGEIRDVASILAPALKGNKPSNLFVYGKTGTGKTAVMKHVTSELRDRGENNGKEVKIIYLNCKLKKVADTEYRLMAELGRKFNRDIPSTGLPTDEVYQRFFDALDEKERMLILILDEIDSLVEKTGDEFLYNLTRINENLERSQVTVVGISNDLSFTDDLDPRVRSSLSEEEILFSPYNASQLQDILKDRANEGFHGGALSDTVIKKCSALAAQEHGDARRAIDLLRVAGELAERSSSENVNGKHVDMAEKKIDKNKIFEVVEKQPRQSQAVLWSILRLQNNGHDDIQTGDVYSVYEDVCESAGLKSLTQRRVSDLISELDMLGVIHAEVTSKGRYGRTRIIKTTLSEKLRNDLKTMLREQYYFN